MPREASVDDGPFDAVETGDALELVDRSRPPPKPSSDLASEMIERYALGDFTGALRMAELLLGQDEGHAEAMRYAEASRAHLEHIYSSRVGSHDRRPVMSVPEQEVKWLGLDHRAAFLLSRVDGDHSVADLLEVSGMARLETLKTLHELLEMGAIRFDD